MLKVNWIDIESLSRLNRAETGGRVEKGWRKSGETLDSIPALRLDRPAVTLLFGAPFLEVLGRKQTPDVGS